MLVWKGWGVLVPLIYLLLTATVREGLGAVGAEDNIALAVGVVLSAILIWFLGKKLNNSDRGKRVIDVESGQEIVLVNSHSLFWINVEYWAIIVPVGGVVIILANL